MKEQNIDPSRRRFLRNLGIITVGTSVGACKPADNSSQTGTASATGTMTYRTNPNTGDTVSILGYGCMRFPTLGMAKDRKSVV